MVPGIFMYSSTGNDTGSLPISSRNIINSVDSCNFITDAPEGYCGVIQLFMLMIRNKMAINDLFTEAEIYQDDIIIGPFLNGLKSELSSDYRHE